MTSISTRYGVLRGVVSAAYYEDGSLKDCVLGEKNALTLPLAQLVPQYGEEHVRRKHAKSASFYRTGALKTVLLEEMQEVMTPMGEFPAELITLYESGEVNRVFPLNGKLSAYWSEEDEAKLAVPFQFEFSFGAFCAKIVCLHFYQSGALKSLTLFPGETVSLTTPIGEVEVKTGFSLYESGALKSVEPAQPVVVMTDIGPLAAFDCNATGIHADSNSLRFTPQGGLHGLVSSSDKIAAVNENGRMSVFAPIRRPLPDGEGVATIALDIVFENGCVTITDDQPHRFDLSTAKVSSLPFMREGAQACTPSDCASCTSRCGM